jgi:hypothetical protein
MTNPLETASVPLALQPPPREDRRLRWYHAKLALGLCGTCGSKPRAQGCDGKLSVKCVECLVSARARERIKHGWKPRYVSGMGRRIWHGAKRSEEVVS